MPKSIIICRECGQKKELQGRGLCLPCYQKQWISYMIICKSCGRERDRIMLKDYVMVVITELIIMVPLKDIMQ